MKPLRKKGKNYLFEIILIALKSSFFNFPFFIFSYMFFLNKSSILLVQVKIDVNSFSLKMN